MTPEEWRTAILEFKTIVRASQHLLQYEQPRAALIVLDLAAQLRWKLVCEEPLDDDVDRGNEVFDDYDRLRRALQVRFFGVEADPEEAPCSDDQLRWMRYMRTHEGVRPLFYHHRSGRVGHILVLSAVGAPDYFFLHLVDADGLELWRRSADSGPEPPDDVLL